MKQDTHSPKPASCCSASPASTDISSKASSTCSCGCTTCRKPRYWLWLLGFFLFYVLSVMPVGLFLYAMKSEAGINLIRVGGYHRFVGCLSEAVRTTW